MNGESTQKRIDEIHQAMQVVVVKYKILNKGIIRLFIDNLQLWFEECNKIIPDLTKEEFLLACPTFYSVTTSNQQYDLQLIKDLFLNTFTLIIKPKGATKQDDSYTICLG